MNSEELPGIASTRQARALVCAPVMPEFDRQSGERRLWHFIEFLRHAGWLVTFVSKYGDADGRYARALRQSGVATYATGDRDVIAEVVTSGEFDVALIAFWQVAEEYVPLVRSLSPSTRVIVDSVDLHFVRNARRAFQRGPGQSMSLLGDDYGDEVSRELNVYATADAVLTVSEKEADLINDLVVGPRLAYSVPDGEDFEPSAIPWANRSGILFLGNFIHSPNIDAVAYLCEQILPLVDSALLSQHPVRIVGNGLDERIRGFGRTLPSVQMVGWVPSIRPYLEQARISAIPLLYGAGTKRKLIQSLMVGTPSVTTSVGAEGLDVHDGQEVLIADEPAAFAKAIERLLTDADLWAALQARGMGHVRGSHTREAVGARFNEVLSLVLAKRSGGPSSSPFVGPAEADHYKAQNSLHQIHVNGSAVAATTTLAAPQVGSPGANSAQVFGSSLIAMDDAHRRRVLVLGIYIADQPNCVDHIVTELSRSERYAVDQRWVALRGAPPTEIVASKTVAQIPRTTPKYEILNGLIQSAGDLAPYDYVLTVDDDILLPPHFLDRYLTLQQDLGFVIAQPARTDNSWIDHPIVQQQPGVAARQTLFVEIGPLVSFERRTYEFVLPFDLTSSMGWGLECVWARTLLDRGLKMGIIDALPVDHSIRPPATGYSWDGANAERDQLLAKFDHLTYDQCFHVLEVMTFAEHAR